MLKSQEEVDACTITADINENFQSQLIVSCVFCGKHSFDMNECVCVYSGQNYLAFKKSCERTTIQHHFKNQRIKHILKLQLFFLEQRNPFSEMENHLCTNAGSWRQAEEHK